MPDRERRDVVPGGTTRLRASDPRDVARAAELLRQGQLVAFPTETVYGLGADALSAEAVQGIFQAKGRPAWDPLIVHVPELEQVAKVANVAGGLARRVGRLAEAFWPGPLTLLLPRTEAVPDAVTAGRELVGVRVPAHPAALALLRAAGRALAAPSANRFGHISPTTAGHVLADLEGRIAAVLDGGPCAVGVESTVLDPERMVMYRAGAVTAEALAAVCGAPVQRFQPAEAGAHPASLPSPGVGLRHYAPEARVRLTRGGPEALAEGVQQEIGRPGARVGVLLPGDWDLPLAEGAGAEGAAVVPWGRWDDPASLAAGLFGGLRALEAAGVNVIVCPLPGGEGLGEALRDRLEKAARPR